MIIPRRLLLRVCPFVLLCLAMVAGAQALPANGAQGLVKAVLDRAMEIQTDPKLSGPDHRDQRARLISELIRENFLIEDMARQSMGENWGQLDTKLRKEYLDLFQVLFQDSYTRMVLNFLGRENISYRGESKDNDAVEVYTVIMRPNEHIPVDYKLIHREGRWYILDVRIDGVSIVETYKNAFGRVIRTGSVDVLLQRMRMQRKAIEEGKKSKH